MPFHVKGGIGVDGRRPRAQLLRHALHQLHEVRVPGFVPRLELEQ